MTNFGVFNWGYTPETAYPSLPEPFSASGTPSGRLPDAFRTPSGRLPGRPPDAFRDVSGTLSGTCPGGGLGRLPERPGELFRSLFRACPEVLNFGHPGDGRN
jgi:hypothetical protein